MNYALFNFQPTNLKLLTLMRVYLEMNLETAWKGCQKAKLSIIKECKAPWCSLKTWMGHLELNVKAQYVQFKQKWTRRFERKGSADIASVITNLAGK